MAAMANSQRNEVLFFANTNFLFFNFLASPQVAHFILSHHTIRPNSKTKRATSTILFQIQLINK